MKMDEVASREQLAAYVRELAHEAARGDLENATLGAFLEALSAWIDDMDGYFANLGNEVPTQPDWKLVAMMLRAATMYE